MIKWHDKSEYDYLYRIFICFEVEDPLKYIQRLKIAIVEREIADSMIRYNFIIDNMPINDVNFNIINLYIYPLRVGINIL